MVEFLRRLGRFLNNMDAKAVTSLSVSVILLFFVIFTFTFGQEWRTERGESALNEILQQAVDAPWAVIGVISVYCVLALTGFPQILLISATVLTFGPETGAFYAWLATMTSASLTFGLGHYLGRDWVRRFGGERVQRSIGFLSRHGVVASALVRVAPSAPFIVVNAAAGAAHIPLWKFWAGTGVGIIPKIALVAVLGALAPDQSYMREGLSGVVSFFTSREPRELVILLLIITAWLIFLLFVRQLYQRLRRRDEES